MSTHRQYYAQAGAFVKSCFAVSQAASDAANDAANRQELQLLQLLPVACLMLALESVELLMAGQVSVAGGGSNVLGVALTSIIAPYWV